MENKKIRIILIFFLAISLAVFLFTILENKKSKITIGLGENTTQNVAENKAETEIAKEEKQIAEIEKEAENNPVQKEKNVSTKKESASDIKIINNFIGWGFESSAGREIDTVIIHSSYNALDGDEYDFKKLLEEYKEYGVAPHYVINRKGNIYRLVSEKNIAYHAGASKVPDGRTGVNNFSIGIEIMTTESDSPTAAQYAALKKLIADIKTRYEIKYVLGHNQIAPGRKTDPWNFDWDKI